MMIAKPSYSNALEVRRVVRCQGRVLARLGLTDRVVL